VDVTIGEGEIASIEPASGRTATKGYELDMSGCLLLQAPAEPQAHVTRQDSGRGGAVETSLTAAWSREPQHNRDGVLPCAQEIAGSGCDRSAERC
jgi:hypothetical protein